MKAPLPGRSGAFRLSFFISKTLTNPDGKGMAVHVALACKCDGKKQSLGYSSLTTHQRPYHFLILIPLLLHSRIAQPLSWLSQIVNASPLFQGRHTLRLKI